MSHIINISHNSNNVWYLRTDMYQEMNGVKKKKDRVWFVEVG